MPRSGLFLPAHSLLTKSSWIFFSFSILETPACFPPVHSAPGLSCGSLLGFCPGGGCCHFGSPLGPHPCCLTLASTPAELATFSWAAPPLPGARLEVTRVPDRNSTFTLVTTWDQVNDALPRSDANLQELRATAVLNLKWASQAGATSLCFWNLSYAPL